MALFFLVMLEARLERSLGEMRLSNKGFCRESDRRHEARTLVESSELPGYLRPALLKLRAT